jgi:hypothetical protein
MSMTNHKVLSVGRWMSFGSEHLQQNSLTGAKNMSKQSRVPSKIHIFIVG